MNKEIVFGTQHFPLKTLLYTDERNTLKAMKKNGYDMFEPYFLLEGTREREGDEKFKNLVKVLWPMEECEQHMKILKEEGFRSVSAHVMVFKDQKPAHIAHCMNRLHKMTGIQYFVVNGMFFTAEDAAAFGEFSKSIAEYLEPGLKLLHHNHNMEFNRITDEEASAFRDRFPEIHAGDYLLDIYLAAAGEKIGLEIDYGWAWYGDADFESLKKYNDRLYIIHLKDFFDDGLRTGKALAQDHEFAAIGEGVVYTEEVLGNIPELPLFNGVIIVDQDYDNDILDSLRRGRLNVLKMLEN